MHNCCGIDFGTSNSAIGIADKNITLVSVEDNYKTIPSALFFRSLEKDILFGREAQKAYTLGTEGRFMRSLKRILGTSLINQTTIVNSKHMSFQKIISVFIKNLKHKAETAGYDLDSVVMGRPVHFVDDDTTADNKAEYELELIAKLVGFKNVVFQYEPIAAAFAHEQNLIKEKLSLVVDIGGGTSDFTVIRLSPNNKSKLDRKDDILANTGIRIGGNDFDKDLSIKIVMPYLGYNTSYGEKILTVPRSDFHDISEWSKVNFAYTSKTLNIFKDMLKESHAPEKLCRFVNVLKHQHGHRLLNSIENAKIDLTDKNLHTLDLDYIENNFALNVSIEEMNNSIKENTLKIVNNINECLQLSGLSSNNIQLIVLTGGSTEITYIQSTLKKMFPNAEISQENKLSSVVTGLAHDAKRRFL